MTNRNHGSLFQEIFKSFPRGLALLGLQDPADVSTWRLLAIDELASSLVVPSIESFISGEHMGLRRTKDLPAVYRQTLARRQPCTIGMVEAQRSGANRFYMVSAFPAGPKQVGIMFEDADLLMSKHEGRFEAERRLSQTCDFLGAIVWRAEPETLRFTYVSDQGQSILGYWIERWLSETNFWKKHIFPEDCERVVNACRTAIRRRKREDFEFRMISAHRQILWFHAAAEAVEHPGGKLELLGVMNDITDLKRAEERVRRLSSRLMRLQDDERRHISRELHDSLGQYLTSIKINFDILKRDGGALSEQHRALLIESSETLEKCVQEVRTVSYLLHPPLLDELGLLAAVRWFTAGFSERIGITVHLDTPAAFSRLPAEMELALFRVVQEALTNVQRHSHSDMAWITLSEGKNRAELRITDRGAGVPSLVIARIKEGKSIEGVGLRGMYERMRELGGQLEIQSSPKGTAVSAVLPLQLAPPTRSGEAKPRLAGERMGRGEVEVSDVHIETEPDRWAGSTDHPTTKAPALGRSSPRRRASRR